MKSGEPRDVKKYLKNPRKYGGIAQLGEHLLCKQGVSGSIPLLSTKGERMDRAERSESHRDRRGLIAQQVRAHA